MSQKFKEDEEVCEDYIPTPGAERWCLNCGVFCEEHDYEPEGF